MRGPWRVDNNILALLRIFASIFKPLVVNTFGWWWRWSVVVFITTIIIVSSGGGGGGGSCGGNGDGGLW